MKLAWLDLETTGLNPRVDSILEIAMAIADFDKPFDVEVVFNEVLSYNHPHMVHEPIVQAMHTKNGLFKECESSNLSLTMAEARLVQLLGSYNEPDKFILAGSSIHFDHSFLAEHMPTLNKYFSHRHYDVSAVKLFFQSLGAVDKFPKAEAHRALADVMESISHAKLCRLIVGYDSIVLNQTTL